MNSKSHTIIRDSWKELQPKRDALAATFYEHVFSHSSEASALFAGTDMAAQRRKFLDMVNEIVRLIDRPDALAGVVAESGRRHARYGVQDRHYADVGAALLSAIDDTLGGAASDVLAAWRDAFSMLAALMQRAAHDAA